MSSKFVAKDHNVSGNGNYLRSPTELSYKNMVVSSTITSGNGSAVGSW
jgi:hypothetical protein